MQCRYVGDVGDFGKYGLLQALTLPNTPDELTLGVVWYLVPNHGPPGDGRYTDYLKEENAGRFRPCDPLLFDCLKEIVDSDRRSVESIEQAGFLPAKYYTRKLTFQDTPLDERPASRQAWLRGAVERVRACKIVFVDPDNGLEVKSASRYRKKGTKYVYYDELCDYVSQNQSVVVYQHMPHESPYVYVRRRVKKLREKLKIRGALWALLWHPYSPRVYFIIPNGREAVLRPRINAMLKRPWGQDRPEGSHFEPVLFP